MSLAGALRFELSPAILETAALTITLYPDVKTSFLRTRRLICKQNPKLQLFI